MSAVRDAIRSANRLTRMRQGQAVFELVELPSLKAESGEVIRLAQVPLTEAETQQGVFAAAQLEVLDNMAGLTARNRIAQVHDAWNSLREPDNLMAHAFESVDEMTATLEPTDIDLAVDSLSILMEYASPSIDNISNEDLDDLKKDLLATDWSALTGRRWAAVKLCCQVLVPELLQAKLSGFSSTGESTKTRDAAEST